MAEDLSIPSVFHFKQSPQSKLMFTKYLSPLHLSQFLERRKVVLVSPLTALVTVIFLWAMCTYINARLLDWPPKIHWFYKSM